MKKPGIVPWFFCTLYYPTHYPFIWDHAQKYVFRISATHSHRLEYAVARVSVWDGAKLPFATHQGGSEHTTGHTVVWQIRESVPFTTSGDHPFRSEAPRRKTHTEREPLFVTK